MHHHCNFASTPDHPGPLSRPRLWWEEEPRRTARFAWQMFKLCDVPDKCNPDVLQLIVKQHLDSPSVLCILLISDVLALIPTYAGR